MSPVRRDFLQRLSLGGFALGGLPLTMGAAEPQVPMRSVPMQADELMALQGQDDPIVFDTSWTEKLTGKYRAVFDVPDVESGSGVWRAGLWVGHYTQVLKAAPGEAQPVIVIRHKGIPMIMQQEFWDRYDMTKGLDVRHPITDKKTKRNPALMTIADDQLPPKMAEMTLPAQIARGVTVLGCNMAFGRLVSVVAEKDKVTPEAARVTALGMMVPGVILQPNGLFGISLAQQHGCAYIFAA